MLLGTAVLLTIVVGLFFLPVQPPEDDDSSDGDGNGAKKIRLKDRKEKQGWRVAVTNLPYILCTEEAMTQVFIDPPLMLLNISQRRRGQTAVTQFYFYRRVGFSKRGPPEGGCAHA